MTKLFVVLLSFPKKILVQYLTSGPTISFHILYSSVFTNHPTIRRYMAGATDKVLKETTNKYVN
jgi:hypothetical protein